LTPKRRPKPSNNAFETEDSGHPCKIAAVLSTQP
jgi:hypothetical protein